MAITNMYGNPAEATNLALQKLRDLYNDEEQNKLFEQQRQNLRSDTLNNNLALLKSARNAGMKTGSSSIKSTMGAKSFGQGQDQMFGAMNQLADAQTQAKMANEYNRLNAASQLGGQIQGMNLNEDQWSQKLKEYQDALNQRTENRQWELQDALTEFERQKALMKYQKDLNKTPWYKKLLGGLFSTGGDMASSWAKGGFKV